MSDKFEGIELNRITEWRGVYFYEIHFGSFVLHAPLDKDELKYIATHVLNEDHQDLTEDKFKRSIEIFMQARIKCN